MAFPLVSLGVEYDRPSLNFGETQHTLTGHSNKVMAAKFLEDNLKVVDISMYCDILEDMCTNISIIISICVCVCVCVCVTGSQRKPFDSVANNGSYLN